MISVKDKKGIDNNLSEIKQYYENTEKIFDDYIIKLLNNSEKNYIEAKEFCEDTNNSTVIHFQNEVKMKIYIMKKLEKKYDKCSDVVTLTYLLSLFPELICKKLLTTIIYHFRETKLLNICIFFEELIKILKDKKYNFRNLTKKDIKDNLKKTHSIYLYNILYFRL